jgi:hypothetical protein
LSFRQRALLLLKYFLPKSARFLFLALLPNVELSLEVTPHLLLLLYWLVTPAFSPLASLKIILGQRIQP